MSAPPTISVGVPVHNGARTLERALRSALEPDRDDLEVVISDNASTDATQEISRAFASADARVRYEPTASLLPVLENFNRAFALTSGTYFRWACDDDWTSQDFSRAAQAALEDVPGAVAAYAPVTFVDDEGEAYLDHDEHLPNANSPDQRKRVHDALWRIRSASTFCFTLARRDAMATTGLLRPVPDASILFTAELAVRGPLVHVPSARLFRHFGEVHRERDHWVWLDPRNADRPRRVAWRQFVATGRVLSDNDLPATSVLGGLSSVVVRRGAGKAAMLKRQVTGERWTAPV